MKNKKIKTPPLPREIADIQKDYGQVSGQYANASYQAKLYRDEANKLFSQMRDLNLEAGARNQLDTLAAKDKEKVNE